MLRELVRIPALTFALALAACTPGDEEDGNAEETGSEQAADPCPPASGMLDESSCMAPATNYVPGAMDGYDACISDGGTYEVLNGTPGAAARIEAYEEIAALLWGDTAPSRDDFLMARTAYEREEGLSSRVERRADLHYPEIPMAEWDAGLDADKQCGNADLAAAYPDYCAGPTKIRPLINQAFIDGIMGEGDPNVNAAKIKGALLWFIILSSYKEASSCYTIAGEDCDASWAYYTGGAQLDGQLLGLAKFVNEHSPGTVEATFDGILAVRCVRDLYPETMYPANPVDPLPADGAALFDMAWEQLDQGLHRSLGIALRQHVEAQDSCGDASAANWAFVQVVGGAMVHEAKERDAANGGEFEGLVSADESTPEDNARIIELIDLIFPCPV